MSPTGHGGAKEMAMSIRQMLVPLAFSAYSPHTLNEGLFRGGLAKQVVRLAPRPVWIAPSSTSATASSPRVARELGRMHGEMEDA